MAAPARPWARSLLNTVVNVPVTASILRRHLGHDAYKATSVTLRAAPGPVRRPLQTAGVRRRAPVLAALGLDASGRRDAAVVLLREVSSRGDAAHLRRVVAAAAAIDRPDLAQEALTRLPADDPHRPRLLALVEACRGNLRQAFHHAGRVPGRAGRELRAQLEGEISVLRADRVAPLVARGDAPAYAGRSAAPSSDANRRVLHVVSNALPEVEAGYTIRTHGIATAQRARGDEPHVVTRLGFPVDMGAVAGEAEIELDGVPYHRLLPRRPLPLSGADHLSRNVAEVVRLAERVRPDLLHAHSKHVNAQVALLAGDRLGLPVVYEVRGFLEETWRSRGGDESSDFYQLSREAETRCMQAAAAVVTLAGSMRDEIVARGVPAEKVHVVPNAVSDDFLQPVPDAARLRAQLGIAENATVFGIISTLNYYEGVNTLIEALERVDDPSAVLLIVGDGYARARLAEQAAPLGRRVVMTGPIPHSCIREYHAAIDVFCMPRRSTPVTVLVPPLKPLEAMACGRPLLASDLPPLREIVHPGEFGDVAAPEDAEDWAAKMEWFLAHAGERQRMGADAREWVREGRTWTSTGRHYERVYATVTRRRGGDNPPTCPPFPPGGS